MEKISENPLLVKWTKIPENPGAKRSLILAIRVLLVSVHRFIKDECLMMASSLAYTTIVTLVPTLTVVFALLTVASGIQNRQGEIFDEVSGFLVKNNIQFDITPYWETLSDIISTASQIGAVGFVVFIFSATAVLRSTERAFHFIWRIDTHRSFVNKFVFYFFLISFGPLLFAIGKGFSDKITDVFRAPHLKSLALTSDGTIWVAGEKGNIGKVTGLNAPIQFIPKSSIDFENMLCVDFSGIETGTCKKPDISKENFFRIRSFETSLFSLSEEGTLLFSSDLGKTWKIHTLKNLLIKDFGISDLKTIFILTDDTRTLRYEIGVKLEEISKFTEKGITPVRVRFFTEKEGFVLDKEGRLWKTADGGKTFASFQVSPKPLNDIFFLSRTLGFVVGDGGAIYRTKDGGNTWISLNHKRYSYDRVWVFSSPKKQDYDVFVLNNLGDILLSEDEGENWKIAYHPSGGDLLDMIHLAKTGLLSEDGGGETDSEVESTGDPEDPTANAVSLNKDMLGIIAVGEYKKMIRIEQDSKGQMLWKKYQGGAKIFSIYTILKVTIPLISIWLFFILLFTLVPNTKVPMHAALIGSAVTGVILILFFWGFLNIYLTSFTEKTMIIYKALAAVPVFLLSIYSVGAIVLFGAEVTATLQFPDRYLVPKHPFDDADEYIKYEFYHALRFLAYVYQYQDKQGKLIPLAEMKKRLNLPEREVKLIKEALEKADLISLNEKGNIAPIRLKEQVNLYELYQKTISFTLGVPETKDPSLPQASLGLSQLEDKVKVHLSSISLKDVAL